MPMRVTIFGAGTKRRRSDERRRETRIELWLQAMREPGLRPRMQQVHRWSCQSVAQMIEQQAQARGIALAMPAADLAQAVLALSSLLCTKQAGMPMAEARCTREASPMAPSEAAEAEPGQVNALFRLV